MADATVSSPAPPKRHRWLRVLGWILGVFIVLLVALYFVATSSAFFKGVILPKASAALNAKITVSDASISPFHEVILRNLRVETTGAEPLLTAPEVRARYSLMDIIGGNIHVEDLTVSSPTIVLVQNPDGTSNLDPLLKSQEPAKPKTETKPSKPMQLDIAKIAITGATVRQVKVYAGEHRDVIELGQVNLTVSNVKNGQTGKLELDAALKMENNPPPPGTNATLQAGIDGNFTFALSPDLKPSSVQGATHVDISRAGGALADAAGLRANLNCDITPSDIKEVALRFQKGQTRLGELRASGPFDLAMKEGRLKVELLNIDKNLLNMAGASQGIDFGPTTINSTNQIQLAKEGQSIALAGQFNLNQFQVTRTNQTTPPLDLQANYDLNVDRAASNVLARTLTMNATQKGSQILHGELTTPMNISWAKTANAVGDSAWNLVVTHLDLANWQAFLADVAPAGDVNGKLQLLSRQAGNQLAFDLDSRIDNLTAGSGSNRISQATVTLQVRGQSENLAQFNLREYKLEIARQNQPLLSASGTGIYDQKAQAADIQLTAQIMLARLLQALPRPDLNVSSGTAELKARIVQKEKDQSVTGTFALTDFSGQMGSNIFRSFGVNADLDIGMNPRQVQIRKVAGQLKQGTAAGGAFELSGTYDLTNNATQLKARLTDFNQNGLGPFLEPMLTDKKLVSVALNANANVQYDPQAASAVKASMEITNLVVNDPQGQIPASALAATLQLDAGIDKKVVDLRQCQLGLTPTEKAKNEVQLSGRLDMTDTNATQGSLKLAADSLDLTRYYDLFGGQKKATTATPAPATAQKPAAAPAPPGPEQEPPAKQLPLRNFTAEMTIGQLFLREVAVTNLQLVSKVDVSKVTINPCKLSINGAPAEATLDLDTSMPGYKYALALNAHAVPLAPLVNSFEPERKGILSGTMTAQARISGAGTTGASLQKSLTGQFDIGSTNLNLSVDSIQGKNASTRVLRFLLDTIAMIPELAKNPAGGATSLVSGLLPGKGAASSGGLSGDLKKSPINSIILQGTAGSGRVGLQQALVQSPAFKTQATGSIDLAPVLTNSTINIPVSVWLEQGAAERIHMTGTPEAGYTKLPDFLTMTGTLGNPQRKINYLALGGTLLQGFGGKTGQVGGALQGLGGLLGGNKGSSTNTSATNQSGNLFRGLGGLLGGGAPANTNAPPGATTNQTPTNNSPVGNLLNNLLGPRKQ